MESVATLNADRTAYLSKMAARQTTYLPLGGAQIQAVIKFQVEHIERGVAARLDSYQKAFSEAGQIPTEQDFTDILNEFKAVHEGLVKQSSAVVTRFLTPGIPSVRVDPGPALAAGSAHGHDRVLRSWKVWRERARLNKPLRRTRRLQSQCHLTEAQKASHRLKRPGPAGSRLVKCYGAGP